MKQVLASLSVVFLASCANFSPSASLVGQDRSVVIQSMGPPHSEANDGQGRRMVYPRGPWGKSTFFVHLNAAGQVTHWEDVLTPSRFERIAPGMRAEEVERLIGPSLTRWSVSKGNQTIWDYPFSNSVCQIFQVAVTPAGVVDSAGYGYAPECGSSW